ncbi:MAG: hypothetical protein Q9175_002458 [Cornicularia normoerica]
MKHWWILDVGMTGEDHFSGSDSDRCEAGMITHDLDFERVESGEAIEDYTGDDEDWYGSEASLGGIPPASTYLPVFSSTRILPLVGQARASNPDNHLKILNTLLEHLADPNVFMDQLLIRYERFLKEYGLQNVSDEIPKSV